jgi:hypothetical protein
MAPAGWSWSFGMVAAVLKMSVPKADLKIVLRPRIYRRRAPFASPFLGLATAKRLLGRRKAKARPE